MVSFKKKIIQFLPLHYYVMLGLFLLQETFRLNVTQFSDGVAELPGHGRFSAERGLGAADTHFISKIAFNRCFPLTLTHLKRPLGLVSFTKNHSSTN